MRHGYLNCGVHDNTFVFAPMGQALIWAFRINGLDTQRYIGLLTKPFTPIQTFKKLWVGWIGWMGGPMLFMESLIQNLKRLDSTFGRLNLGV